VAAPVIEQRLFARSQLDIGGYVKLGMPWTKKLLGARTGLLVWGKEGMVERISQSWGKCKSASGYNEKLLRERRIAWYRWACISEEFRSYQRANVLS
jgi:hypothetical protein